MIPDRKVQVGAGMGGLSVVIAWAITAYTGIEIPVEIGISASTFLTFIAQYFVPNQ